MLNDAAWALGRELADNIRRKEKYSPNPNIDAAINLPEVDLSLIAPPHQKGISVTLPAILHQVLASAINYSPFALGNHLCE
jgi:hypothetical protein